jgi:two-component system sensor histidine kinase VanS
MIDFLDNLGIDRDLHLVLMYYKGDVVAGISLIIVVFGMFYSISKVMKYMGYIVESIDVIIDNKGSEELIKLPKEFEEVQDKLNKIKFDAIKNEQRVQEAENKKNELIVYMAHDLKTPLTSIIGYLSLLKDEDDMPKESRKKYIGIALDKSKRLEDLTNEFFEITRFNLHNISLVKQDINLSYMLEQLVDEGLLLLNNKGLTCNLDIEKDIHIQADSDKLARVFDNLLKNAVNYSYENTEILISLKSTDNNVEIIFKNRADKIPDYKLEKIFEKFYRLDDSRGSASGGAGLGLAIAKQIVELHEGNIYVKSDEEYTEFKVTLPI